ncbi:SMI1/KNR4 family protein [Streptomyces lonarensis]|uniref:SMI1/KNR4 family protein n=1 Tax=Streptomyces lonarensis TaxID=700599 RepID=A0A7X6D0W9_9ACTN|nr:SMI1/KNR4 family protein [Streptomyces lonarensis]NJQ06102.1 SMI1/KNR4 family protein [Streptomyces lonarensis]
MATRFEEISATFWDAPDPGTDPATGPGADAPPEAHGGDDARHPPLTDEGVAEAERTLGVTLPPELLTLLRLRNGGTVSTRRDAFPTERPNAWADDHVPFDELLGIGDPEDGVSLVETPYLVQEWGLPSPVVLLSGDGHTWIALDYRSCGPHGRPPVVLLAAADGSGPAAVTPLAPDFRSFVEGLTGAEQFRDDDPEA